MLIECKTLLEGNITAEAMDTLIRADKILNELEIHSQDSSLTNIVLDDNALSQADRIDGVRQLYLDQTVTIIGNFGIAVSDQATLRDVVCVLEGLSRLDNWADEDSILDTCKEEGDNIEILANLLAIVTEVPSEHYLDIITDVDPAFLTRLVETIEYSAFRESPTIQRLVDEIRDRILYWIKEFPESRLRYWLEDKIVPGEPVDYYLSLLTPIEVEAIHNAPEFAADYILSAVVMSNTMNNMVESTVHDIFDNTFNDLAFITKVDQLIEKQLAAFRKE